MKSRLYMGKSVATLRGAGGRVNRLGASLQSLRRQDLSGVKSERARLAVGVKVRQRGGDRADHHQRIAIVNGPAVVAYVARERIAGRYAQRELGAALGAEIERREGYAGYDSGRRISAGSSARLPMT